MNVFADFVAKDPPPDLSKYDCRRPGRQEWCLIKDTSGKEIRNPPSNTEKLDRTSLGIGEDNQNSAWNCSGTDNLKITLNSSGRLFLSTNVSVTVGLNPKLMSQEKVDTSEIKSLDSSIKPSQYFSMGEYYSQGTFSSHRKHTQNNCQQELNSWCYPKTNDLNGKSCSQSSPMKKKVLSPRNGISPNKRKKPFSPQKNKIYKYFVQTNGINVKNTYECAKGEHVSSFHSNITGSLHADKGRYSNYNEIVKNCVDKHSTLGVNKCEVIVISSDEDDSAVSVRMKDDVEEASWPTLLNTSDSYDKKPVVPANISDTLKQNMSNKRHVPVNLSNSPIGTNIDNDIISIHSSDDDDDLWISSQTVIDLTCDDLCSSDDAGGVIVPESKNSKKNLVEKDCDNDHDEDGDDDCISVISYRRGLHSQRKDSIKEDLDIFLLDEENNETKNYDITAFSNQVSKRRTSFKGSTKSDERLLDSPVPPSISHLKMSLDDLCSEFSYMRPLENPSENNKSIIDSLEMQDGNTTDSSLASPYFEDHMSVDDSPEENDQVTLSKESSESYNYERTDPEYKRAKKTKRSRENRKQEKAGKHGSILNKKENCFSETSLPTPAGSDTSSFSFDDIVSQCQMGEKGEEDELASIEMDNKSFPRVIMPSAMYVCQVQAEILLSKVYQPWIDLETDEVPQCCIMGPAECHSLHGKKELCPEEADYYDELLLLRMDCGTSAIDLVQSRLDLLVYPTTPVVQNLLFGCMDLWEEGVTDVLCWLRQLLRLHPPCAFGMLEYYKKVLFDANMKLGAPDGIFWFCVTKIEEAMNDTKYKSSENSAAPNTCEEQESSDFVEKFLECADPLLSCEQEITCKQEVPCEQEVPCDKKMHVKTHCEKLKQLFDTLDYLIRLMEADLDMGLLKNIGNLKRYTCKAGRPLIAVALWGSHSNVGNVNTKCRHLMKLYLQVFESYYDAGYHRYFRRLLSLMAGITYASERNSEPPKYPNIECNCRDLANNFSSIMMASALNMKEIRLILESLKPDWFRLCVCSNLLEKLYGRNMELSLTPYVILLKGLSEVNQEYPSNEEISKTLLAEQDTNKDARKDCEELSPNYVKQATKKDKRGETRLHIACRRNNIQEVERLLNVPGISINEKDNMGWTPLHEASFHGNAKCVKCLVNFRTPSGGPAVDIRARSNIGVTPLMDAVCKNHLEVAAILLQYGGQELLSDENKEGLSVWDLARTEEMKCVLLRAQDHGLENDIRIPRTLYVKLAVLTPLAIIFYIKFSEVMRMARCLEVSKELSRNGESLVKLQPLAFKQDYLNFKQLQLFLKDKLKDNKLLESLTSIF